MSLMKSKGGPKILPGPVTEILNRKASEPQPNYELNRTRLEAVADRIFTEAEKGDPRHTEILFKYLQPQTKEPTYEDILYFLKNAPDEYLAMLAGKPVNEQKLPVNEPKLIEAPKEDKGDVQQG